VSLELTKGKASISGGRGELSTQSPPKMVAKREASLRIGLIEWISLSWAKFWKKRYEDKIFDSWKTRDQQKKRSFMPFPLKKRI
jgi:hypothetical protein